MDQANKEKVSRLRTNHYKISESFLQDNIVPRYIVFVDEKKNIIKLSQTGDIDLLTPHELKEVTSNIVINVNYFIAKYDFEIANKIRPNVEPRD